MSDIVVQAMVESRLTAADMMRVFGLKQAAFYKWLAVGRFDPFEIKPRIGRRLWSAKKVQLHLDGERVSSGPRARGAARSSHKPDSIGLSEP